MQSIPSIALRAIRSSHGGRRCTARERDKGPGAGDGSGRHGRTGAGAPRIERGEPERGNKEVVEGGRRPRGGAAKRRWRRRWRRRPEGCEEEGRKASGGWRTDRGRERGGRGSDKRERGGKKI